jgi:arabinose-5-phosphate isomerase
MTEQVLNLAKRVLEIEANGIMGLVSQLNQQFVDSVQCLHLCKGKVIVTGIGKSGHIARKLASTLSSTGTSSVYLHPAESSHGDLGVISEEDVVIAISYSGGSSAEMNQILAHASRKKVPVIALTSNPKSSLGAAAQHVVLIRVALEACPLNLAPTASSTATLAMADALAMCLLDLKGFRAENFAELHPGGSLGARLLTRVKDVMHTGEAIPLVALETSLKEVLTVMTHRNVRGAAGVMNDQNELVGVITDGDIRRRLEREQSLSGKAQDFMTLNPRTIDAEEMAEKALFVMEQFKIQLLFVLDKSSSHPRKPVGIVHIQDLLTAKIR